MEVSAMNKTATNVMKSMKPQRKKLKKGMDKAMGTLSHLVDNITYMVK